MATRENLKRLYLDAKEQKIFARRELKDYYAFYDSDFSLLKRKGILIEVDFQFYSVNEDLINETFRHQKESELLNLIRQEKFKEALQVLGILFGQNNRGEERYYNYILFLLSYLYPLSEDWRNLVASLSREDILKKEKTLLNDVRSLALDSNFQESLIYLRKLLRSGEILLDTNEETAKILLEFNYRKQMLESKVLLEFISKEDYESIVTYLESSKSTRLLSANDLYIIEFSKILFVMRKYRVIPAKIETRDDDVESLIKCGQFELLAKKRRENLKAKKHSKNLNMFDILLIRINRLIEENSKTLKGFEPAKEISVETMCLLYDLTSKLGITSREKAQVLLEEFLKLVEQDTVDYGTLQNIYHRIISSENILKDKKKF